VDRVKASAMLDSAMVRKQQTVQEYFADREIGIHDMGQMPLLGIACMACEVCLGGSILFLTPERFWDALAAEFFSRGS